MYGDREVADYVAWRTVSGRSSQVVPCNIHQSCSLLYTSRPDQLTLQHQRPIRQLRRMDAVRGARMPLKKMDEALGVTNSDRDWCLARQHAGKMNARRLITRRNRLGPAYDSLGIASTM